MQQRLEREVMVGMLCCVLRHEPEIPGPRPAEQPLDLVQVLCEVIPQIRLDVGVGGFGVGGYLLQHPREERGFDSLTRFAKGRDDAGNHAVAPEGRDGVAQSRIFPMIGHELCILHN